MTIQKLDGDKVAVCPEAMQPTSSASSADLTNEEKSEGHVTVTTNEAGECVAVTLQDEDHCILRVFWQRPPAIVQAPIGFDEWQKNPYTIALQRSIHEDYEPRKKAEHFDDHAVDCFAKLMKAKMAKKRGEGRSGWDDSDQCTVEYLSQLLHEHVAKGDPVDVANICMMIRHYDAPIASPVVAAIPGDTELLNKFIESFAAKHGFGPGDQEIWDAARASVAAPIVATGDLSTTVPSEQKPIATVSGADQGFVQNNYIDVLLPTGTELCAAPSPTEQANDVRPVDWEFHIDLFRDAAQELRSEMVSFGMDEGVIQRAMQSATNYAVATMQQVYDDKSATLADKGNAPAEAKS